MRDPYSEPRLALLHPKVRDTFRDFIDKAESGLKLQIRIVQGLRTFAEQDALYAQGRTTAGSIVTNAKGGESYHNYGLAIDVAPIDNGEPNWAYNWANIVALMPEGIVSGTSFKMRDKDHFEISFGHSVHDLLDLYNSGKVDAQGYVLL